MHAQKLTVHAFLNHSPSESSVVLQETSVKKYPKPGAVLRKSMIIPGWGQITNKQAWKVPIIYGLLGGLAYYSVWLTQQYHDYRAAFYNVTNGVDSDFRFGQTPANITSTNTTFLRAQRNSFRNRRDFIYVSIVLAYGLNLIDAYVYAHLRSFDVSDDLSMNVSIKPEFMQIPDAQALGLSVSMNLFRK